MPAATTTSLFTFEMRLCKDQSSLQPGATDLSSPESSRVTDTSASRCPTASTEAAAIKSSRRLSHVEDVQFHVDGEPESEPPMCRSQGRNLGVQAVLDCSNSNQMLLLSHFHPAATYTEVLVMLKRRFSPLGPRLSSTKLIYPIRMDQEKYQLVEYMHADHISDSKRAASAFRTIWFGMILRDPAAFLQNLGTTLAHQNFLQGKQYEDKAVQYQQMALRSVNERLVDPVLSLSDRLVAAVVSFLTYDHMIQDAARYKADKVKLACIVQARGGIETLENNAEVRLMILWDDVCGACSFDVKPDYGLPTKFLPPIPEKALLPPSPSLVNIMRSFQKLYPKRREFLLILHDFHILHSMLKLRYPEIFDDPWFLGLHINPLLLRLLSLSRADSTISEHSGPVEKSYGLAVLIYLADIRVRFMDYHVTGYHFIEMLKSTVVGNTEVWHGLKELRLWILVVGGIKSSESDRPFFINAIAKCIEGLGIMAWNAAMQIVTSVFWIDEIYGERAKELGRAVMSVC